MIEHTQVRATGTLGEVPPPKRQVACSNHAGSTNTPSSTPLLTHLKSNGLGSIAGLALPLHPIRRHVAIERTPALDPTANKQLTTSGAFVRPLAALSAHSQPNGGTVSQTQESRTLLHARLLIFNTTPRQKARRRSSTCLLYHVRPRQSTTMVFCALSISKETP